MSDIGASDAGAAPEAAPSEAPVEAFDLDAAVEEFATSAPDEWKGKASKIQSELKNLRGNYTPYRDTFDGLHEDDKNAVFELVKGLKEGKTEDVVSWMLTASKGLSGDKFDAMVEKLTPKQAEALADEMEAQTAEGTEKAPEQELSVEEQVNKILADRDSKAAETKAMEQRQAGINTKFAELGLSTERDDSGRLVDFKAQQVAQMAINHGGDIDKGFEAFNKWLGDEAKSFLQNHADAGLLAPSGEAAAVPDLTTKAATPKERAKARILRAAQGPAA